MGRGEAVRHVDVDFADVLAASDRYHDAVVAMLTPLGFRAALVAGLKAGTGCDDEMADALANLALEAWSVGEGAVSDRARALATEAVAIINEAKAICSMPPTLSARAALSRRYVVASVHVPRGHR